jgi:hypothetical protein
MTKTPNRYGKSGNALVISLGDGYGLTVSLKNVFRVLAGDLKGTSPSRLRFPPLRKPGKNNEKKNEICHYMI